MGDAPGELADRLHLLRLAQRILGDIAPPRRLLDGGDCGLLPARPPECEQRQCHQSGGRGGAEKQMAHHG